LKLTLPAAAPAGNRFDQTKEAPFQEFSIEHINFFSPRSLTNLMQQFGMDRVFLSQSILEPNPGKLACEIEGLFVKREISAASLPDYDLEAEAAITRYISESMTMEKQVHQVIDQIVSAGRPILVWGVGSHTQRLLATSRLSHANIQVFIDSNPRYQGKTLLGKPIVAPGEARNYRDPILIASRGYQQEIDHVIKQVLKLPNEVLYLYSL
jgi:hypothetical protein